MKRNEKDFDENLKRLIDERIAQALQGVTVDDLEMLTVEEAVRLCYGDSTPINKGVIFALIDNDDETGFPAVRLGPRTIRINKRKLIEWLDGGGLKRIASAPLQSKK